MSDERNMLISIIVPIYNVGFYLKKCIESVIAQTYAQLDIILVDDGSTDESATMCDEFVKNDKRITVFHQQNKGLVCARKAGLEVAKGDYVAFVDGDDWIEPEMYELLLNRLVETDADFVHSEWYVERDGNIIDRHRCLGSDIYDETYDKKTFLKECLCSIEMIDNTIWSKLYKKDFIKKCYMNVPDEQSQGEDLLCFCECVLMSQRIAVYHEAYYHYVYRGDSLSHNTDILSLAERCKCYYYLGKVFSRYGCGNSFINLQNHLLVSDIARRLNKFEDFLSEIPYHFNQIEKVLDKKIVICGAGRVGKDYYAQICRQKSCKIVAWADSDSRKLSNECTTIIGLDEVYKLDFDIVIIAVKDEKIANEITEILLAMGVPINKIIWSKPRKRILS